MRATIVAMEGAQQRCSLCNRVSPAGRPTCSYCGAYWQARNSEEAAATAGPPSTSAMAVTGFVLALTTWWIPLIGPLIALIVSVLGLRQARDPAANRTGAGLAWAGITISALGLLLIMLLIVLIAVFGESATTSDGSWRRSIK